MMGAVPARSDPVLPQHPQLQPLRRADPASVGPYALLSRLGAGSMGRVYLGRSASGRLVAVKTIRVEYAEEPDFRARFAREVSAARRVSGVFTAAVVAADPDAAVPWLATAYVPAPSLARLVAACGPMPVPAVRWLAAGCAEALDSIHGAGLVHRDLKPSNVLVSQDGPRVIDFGVARAVERAQLTATRGALGTPAYMAPEQARDTRQASPASDVFSLGSTLAYAATGHPPYRGETVTDVLLRLATEPPDLTGLPPDLAGVVTGCLEPEPANRPTPAALLAAFAPDMHLDADGPPSLPAPARHLMEDYRQRPRGPSRVDEEEEAADRTLGSHYGSTGSAGSSVSWSVPYARWAAAKAPALPAGAPSGPPPGPLSGTPSGPPSGPPSGTPSGAPAGTPSGAPSGLPAGTPSDAAGSVAARSRATPPGRSGSATGRDTAGPSRRRVPLPAVLLAVGAAALLAGGVVLGSWLGGVDQPARPGPQRGVAGPPAEGHPPPPPPGEPPPRAGPPTVNVSQPHGDGHTVFVVYGRGWPPGTGVTVALAGGPTSPTRPVVDRAGAFNYAVNQGHEFFPGVLPPGTHTVVVSGGGRTLQVDFLVRP
jgi:serine/threonine protein kinase